MIIGLSGLSGSGKDTVADILVENGFAKIALADPMKRFCAEMFGWDEERLWGPSALRNAIDDTKQMSKGGYLSARHALQQLGTQWGRSCYENVWVDYGLRLADSILRGTCGYSSTLGATMALDQPSPPIGVVITDIRFPNELSAVRRRGGEVWRIVRPDAGLQGHYATHESETGLSDFECDRIIMNDGSIEDLRKTVTDLRFNKWGGVETDEEAGHH